jgi:hypothetical protein
MSPAGPVVWGVEELGGLEALGLEEDGLVRRYSTGNLTGWPRGYADVNGDASPDLLVQVSQESVAWLLTRGPGTFPDSAAAWSGRGRALGLFQLDADPAFETLLARRDTLLLVDDHLAGQTRLLQVLVNPNRGGFNDWGPRAAVGDFDGDGLLEIACGDAEGFVSRFEGQAAGDFQLDEWIDTRGTYAYELLALPEGGLLVGRQRSLEVTGDGFPAAVYEFTSHAAGVSRRYPFLAQENELRAGAAVARSPATGDIWLALVQGRDLYMARGAAEPRELVLRLGEADGEPPVLADLDADGFMELVLPTAGGSVLYRLRESHRGPQTLRAQSLGPQHLRLTWEPGEATSFRIWRRPDTQWENLGTTSATTWIDSTLQGFVDFTYEIDGLLPDGTRVRSNAVTAHAQPLPRWLEARPLGEKSLRLRASNPLQVEGLEPRRFRVRTQEGGEARVDQVSLAEGGRVVDLILDGPLPCGAFTVETQNVRDDQGGEFVDAANSVQGTHDCPLEALVVVGVGYRADLLGIEIEWSREPDATADAVSSYALRWDDQPLDLGGVSRLEARHSLLALATTTPPAGRGIPYVLRIVAPITAAADGAPLASPEQEHRVYVEGRGAPQVFPVPNPVRGLEVVFAEAADDTRVQIYTLQGQLVREIQGALGGGLSWDLRNQQGHRVASGVYLYVARDARGSSAGRLAVLR